MLNPGDKAIVKSDLWGGDFSDKVLAQGTEVTVVKVSKEYPGRIGVLWGSTTVYLNEDNLKLKRLRK